MNRKFYIKLAVSIALIGTSLLVYPHVTIQTEDKLIAFRYSDDIGAFETEVSLDERYTYYAEKAVTWTGFDFKKAGPFYVLLFDIQPENLIDSMYILDEAYMEDFLKNATIEAAKRDQQSFEMTTDDVAAVLAGKKAVVSNTRYVCPDYDTATTLHYILNGESNVMYLFEVDGLLAIQIGYPDEGPRFIAYK